MASKRAKLSFLDLEAHEADENDDEGFDDEENTSLEGFILRDDEAEREVTVEDEIYQDLGLDQVEQQEETLIAEALARAKKRANEGTEGDAPSNFEHLIDAVTSSTLKLWELTVKKKSEKHLSGKMNDVYRVLKLREEKRLVEGGTSLEGYKTLFSFQAHYVKGLHGRIFIATDDLKRAAQKLSPYLVDKTAFRKFSRVPALDNSIIDSNYNTLEYLRSQFFSGIEIRRYDWVRVRRGRYRGDIALVIDPHPRQQPERPLIVVVPRFDEAGYLKTLLDLSASSDKPRTPSGTKRRHRQAAQLLNSGIYDRMHRSGAFRTDGKRLFLDGLEVIRATRINLEQHPLISNDEIHPFANLEISSQACRNLIRKISINSWSVGDRAYVFQGLYTGSVGVIEEVDLSKDPATVNVSLDGVRATLDCEDVRREFSVGTWVRIAWGRDRGRIGVIVKETVQMTGTVDLWSPVEAVHVHRNKYEWTSVQERINDIVTRLENIQSEELLTFQDFLESYREDISFTNQRHPFAAGVISPLSVEDDGNQESSKVKEGTQEESYPNQTQSRVAVPSVVSSTKRPVFTFGRATDPQENTPNQYFMSRASRDSRLGKYAQIIATGLKGYFGQILDISCKTVTINLAGRIPPYATVNLGQAVCLDRLDVDMAGKVLRKPLKMPVIVHDPPAPRRSPTPLPEPSATISGPRIVDLGEAAFLLDRRINSFAFHIFVHFDLKYDGSKWHNRIGYTDHHSSNTIREDGGFDICSGPEIIVNWTDSHNAQPIRRHVPVAMLKRVPPNKKGQKVVVLKDGKWYGSEQVVQSFSRKNRTAVIGYVFGSRETKEFAWGDLCRIAWNLED